MGRFKDISEADTKLGLNLVVIAITLLISYPICAFCGFFAGTAARPQDVESIVMAVILMCIIPFGIIALILFAALSRAYKQQRLSCAKAYLTGITVLIIPVLINLSLIISTSDGHPEEREHRPHEIQPENEPNP